MKLNNNSRDHSRRARPGGLANAPARSSPARHRSYGEIHFQSPHNRATRTLSYVLVLGGAIVASVLVALLLLWYRAALPG